jgi:pimeloyl-ACP methyl ester carboxylesterase
MEGQESGMTRRRLLGMGGVALLGGCAGTETPDMAHPPVGGFATVDGLRVHYAEIGEGPAVVLIHGASGNLRDFTFSLTGRLAAEGFRAIALDRPGFGYTDRPPQGGEDPAVQARLLRAAVRSLGVERPVVVGHSYGGAVAMAWAVDAPEATAGVLSLAGATYPWGGDAGALYRLGASDLFGGAVLGLARLMVDPANPDPVLARIFRPDPVPRGYGEHVGVGLALRADTFRANARDLDALNDLLAAQAPRYRGLPVPVEAIHGQDDRTVWAEVHSEPLVRDVAQGRLTLLPGVGHMPHHADEDAVVAAVRRLAEAA